MHYKLHLPTPEDALPGRDAPLTLTDTHVVTGASLTPPFAAGLKLATFAMGCFWGAERRFWQSPGVRSTAVGYLAGLTPNPTYREVCSGRTGHTEGVLVVFDPEETSYEALLQTFWESHDPTQGMRQGNDRGTQYRSGIYTHDEAQQALALASREAYQSALQGAGQGQITTEILPTGPFYYAEPEHQQYLAKNPQGYCGLGGCNVSYPRS